MAGAGTQERNRTNEDAVRQELQAAYARAGKAFREKDAEALMRMVAPGFTQQMPDGRVIGFAEAEAGLREWFATADKVTRYEIRIGPLAVQGDQAVATVDEEVAMTFAGRAGKPHERVQSNQCRMTWVRTADGWRIRQSEYLSAKMTVDGVSAAL